MVAKKQPMSDLISLQSRFLRSVNLERDFYTDDAASSYIVTSGSLSAISLLHRGISAPAYRAQCITGPYGSGKSALMLYFAKLLDKTATPKLRKKAHIDLGELAKDVVPNANQGYITVLVTGSRENLSSSLIHGLVSSLENAGKTKLLSTIRRKYKGILANSQVQIRVLVSFFEDVAKLAVEQEKALGLTVIIDELGKSLEYAALHPEQSDIQVLQDMAEAAARSHQYPMWFITILHQEFSSYASRLGHRHQREWAKVQQRFFPVPNTIDAQDSLKLIAAALNSSSNKAIAQNQYIGDTINNCIKLAPRGTGNYFADLCTSAYPLHPTVLVLLPNLFRKFGQNERSLFSFLSANESFSLSNWAADQVFNKNHPAFLRIPQLFDYVYNTLIGGAPQPHYVQIWAEVEDALSRLGDATPQELDIFKTIALLGLVGDSAYLSANSDTLHLALNDSLERANALSVTIKSLEDKKLIVYRRFRDTYRLWEGSDIDISERLVEAYQLLPLTSISLSVARDLCPSPPIVARRHAHLTGMVRYFLVTASNHQELKTTIDQKDKSDCYIVQCLVENNEQWFEVESLTQSLEDTSMVILLGKDNDELTEAARDVSALEWVKNNTLALAGDRAARQELAERRLEAETAFLTEWDRIFDTNSVENVCYWNGNRYQQLSSKDFFSLLSDACDTTFPDSPIVKNELINRRYLSTTAAAARRKLIEAIISSGDKPGLNITGYPPERSIYESILLTSGIHRKGPRGLWKFHRPNKIDPGLQKAWDHIISSTMSNRLKPKSVNDLFDELTNPPYGIANGLLPVLLCACLQANRDTMALYEEGAFVPEITGPTIDRLMKNSSPFSILSFSLDRERASVLRRFADGFKVKESLLPIVRSLYARIRSLPKYAQITSNLPPNAISVRDIIFRAKRPEKLLFSDLPQALGCQPFPNQKDDQDIDENMATFFNNLNAVFKSLIGCYPSLLNQIKTGALTIFEIHGANNNWRESITSRSEKLLEVAVDQKLRSLLIRTCDRQLEDNAYLESIGDVIVGQPTSLWSLEDERNFARLLPVLKSQIQSAESTQDLQSALTGVDQGYMITINKSSGREMRKIVRYSPQEKTQIEQVIDYIKGNGNNSIDKKLLLAALSSLVYELIDNDSADNLEDS